jgi:cell division protein FtsZ
VGQAAAQESQPEIIEFLEGAHMVFVAAGMGGGTGTGAAPVIARTARERGILTIAVVTKPFHFEGQRRMQLAEAGVQELRKHVDTLIVIPNQNLFRVANERTTFAEAFQLADQVLYSGVRGVTDLMVMPGLINLDFADVRTVMAEMGTAMMGTGEAFGPNRALDAAHGAMANPLLDIVSMRGAKGVLINITGGFDMTLYEVDQAANEIRAEVDANANIILGSTFDEQLEGKIRVSVVATGIDDEAIIAQNTVVEPARCAAETTPRRPVVQPRATSRAIRRRVRCANRPTMNRARALLNDIEPNVVRRRNSSLRRVAAVSRCSVKKPEPRDDEPREFNLDAPDPDIETPRRSRDEAARDPSLDEGWKSRFPPPADRTALTR